MNRTLPLALLAVLLPAARAQTAPAELNIVVVAGEGATTSIRQRSTADPVVRIEDEAHKPVNGAAVVFTLPTEATTGEFGNGSKTVTIMTDNRGVASAKGLKVNGMPGKLPIHVTASYRGLTATTTITQFTTAPPGAKISKDSGGGGHHGKLIVILALLGGAAAGGAVAATHGGSSSGSTPTIPPGTTPIGITAGTGTVGGH